MASAAWEGRNARARALGFKSYYDYRAHDYGRRPASEPRAAGAELRRLRGHSSGADLDRQLASGNVELVNVIQTRSGLRPEFQVLITKSDGTTSSYTVKSQKQINKIRGTLDTLGADAPRVTGSDTSVRGFLGEAESEEELAAELEAMEAVGANEPELFEPGEYDPDEGIPF